LDGDVWIVNVTIHNIIITEAASNAIHLEQTGNVTISFVSIDSYVTGIYLHDTANITLNNVSLHNGELGIDCQLSQRLTMDNCTISSTKEGLQFGYYSIETADHDIDSENTFNGKPIIYIFNETGTTHYGFDTYHLSVLFCDRVTIADAILSGDTVTLGSSSNCTLANSSISTSIETYIAHDMLFIGNVFEFAGRLNFTRDYGDTNLTFTLNAFMSQYYFYWVESQWMMNASDYGNYWYSYTGVDENLDGIGDTPHQIGGGNYDYLPLITDPYGARAYITNIIPANETAVGDTIDVSVTVTVLGGVKYDGALSTATTVTLNGTEIGSGGTGTIEFDLDTTSYSDGLYILRIVVVIDSLHTYSTLHVFTIDNNGPVITPDIEDEHAFSSSTLGFYVDCVDTHTSVIWTAYYANGTFLDNYTGSYYPIYATLTPSVEGLYILNFTSSDAVGNIASITIAVYYDTSDPTLSNPSDLTYPEGSTGNTVTFTASDMTPSHYNVTIGGESWLNATWTGGDILVNVDGLSEGYHSLNIEVHDRAGHISYGYVSITVTESTITTTTTTTTTTGTETTTTGTTTTTTTGPTGEPIPTEIILVIVGAGGVIVVIIIVVMMKKRR
jgi:hypothetical protein